MKIKSAQADPDALPHGLKEVQVRATKHGVVVQRKATRSKGSWSPLQRQYRQRFAFAARMAANPNPFDLGTAIEMAKGTEQVPRDILTMAALGRYYIITEKDGTEWGHVEGPIAPKPEPPPPPPDPEPVRSRWSLMQWNHWDAAWTSPNDITAVPFKGGWMTPRIDITTKGVATILHGVAGATYKAAIGTADAGNAITSIALSDPLTPATTGVQSLFWDMAVPLTAGQRYFWLVGRTDATDTTQLLIWIGAAPRWLWPCTQGQGLRLAKAAPAIGHVLAGTASNNNPPFGIDF